MAINGQVLAFVMAGGRGTRLKVLTKDRCKSAVDILGHYRIFDFVASNIEDTGIPIALVATQFDSEFLSTHIGDGEAWGFDGIHRKIEIVDPCKEDRDIRFEGTADSVRKSVDRIDRYNPDIVLVLGSDHVYSMDYTDAIKHHKMNNADITIMTNVVPDSKVSDFSILKIDESGRIIDFAEKPTDTEVIENFRLTARIKERLGIDDPDLNFLASMGNYVFFWDRLKRFLDFPGVDFGKHIIPAIKESSPALYAYVFNGYWRDVGRIRDYFDCNMDFTNGKIPIASLEHRVKTYDKYPPSAQIDAGASVENTILGSGDVICHGSTITNSVLGDRVVIEEGCALDHCILLGADGNGSHSNRIRGEYTMRIGKGSSLSYAILGKNVWVGEGVDISPHNGTPERRGELLQSTGLKPYRELDDGTVDGDFYIDPDTGILVIGKQHDDGPKKPVLPDGLKC